MCLGGLHEGLGGGQQRNSRNSSEGSHRDDVDGVSSWWRVGIQRVPSKSETSGRHRQKIDPHDETSLFYGLIRFDSIRDSLTLCTVVNTE